MYSTSYSSGIPGMMADFNISNKTIVVLGMTTYLCALAVGSLFLAPLSEMFGRRPIYIVSLALFTVLVLPCALAKNLEAILVTRFFGALAGSAMIANAPGTVADIVNDEYRAFAFSIWSIGPMNGVSSFSSSSYSSMPQWTAKERPILRQSRMLPMNTPTPYGFDC